MTTLENIDQGVIKKTQETLGKYVKKPAFTEKLLKKPPFRFLHDVVNAVNKETGILNGLYTKSELVSDNIKDRDAKISFLQKLIDVIKIVTNENITARPSKIVAGHEPEKTNEVLQLLGKIIDEKLDCSKAIETINTNLSPVQKTTNKTKTKELGKENKASVNDKKQKSKIPAAISKKDQPKEKPNLAKAAAKSKEDTKQIKKIIKKDSTDSEEKSKTAEKKVKTQKKAGSNKTIESNGKHSNSFEVVKENSEILIENSRKIESKVENNEINTLLQSENELSMETDKLVKSLEKPRKNSKDDSNVHQESNIKQALNDIVSDSRKSSAQSSLNYSKDTGIETATVLQDSKENNENDKNESGKKNDKNRKSSITTTNTATTKPAEIKRQSTFTRDESNENDSKSRPRTSLRPPSVRPASARPGAPRRRDKSNVEIVLQPNDQVKLAGIQVKLESFNTELEDDGENLVIIENITSNDLLNHENVNLEKHEVNNNGEDNKQGHLVQQILETQKELVQNGDNNNDVKNDQDWNDIDTIQKRQSSAKQMNSLRDVIQNLTRSVNPLGKLMDFIPEDIDSMQLELTMWRDNHTQTASELKKEKSLTESAIEPMKNQLSQINVNIKEYTDMIDAIHSKILQNSEKINYLLMEQ